MIVFLRRWFLVWLAYLSLFTFGLIDNGRGPVFPDFLKELSLTDAKGSWFFFVASTAALLNNVLLFRWIERIGAYRTTQVYSLLQAVGLIVVGVGRGYPMTLLGCAIFGLSFGGLGISVNVLVAEGAPSRILRQAFAGLHCMYGGASLVAPLLVTLLYHLGANWRSALAWLALAPLVVVAVTLVFAEPMETREMRRRLHAGPTGAESVPKASRNWRAAAYFSALMTLYVISEISVSTRLALLTRREWGYSIEQANQILAGFFLGMFSGRLLFALIPLGMKSRYVLAWSAALSFLSYALALQVHPAWILLTGLAMSVFYPCAISMVNEGRAPREAHFITTWAITAQSLGVMFLHPMLGILADHYGLGRALWMGPISVMGALALLWWAVRFQPQSNCAIT